MIATNITEQIREQIADAIGIRSTSAKQFTVDIPWSFPDGDQCRVYVEKSDDGKWTVSDGGDSVMRASYSGDIDILSKDYSERFQGILRMRGLTQQRGEVSATSVGDLGEAVFTVAQASVDIVQLARMPKEKKVADRSRFLTRLGDIIGSAVPYNLVASKWHDEVDDAELLYEVDYRIDSKKPSGNPLFVFGANTSNACIHATMSCLFYRTHGHRFSAIAVYNEDNKIPRKEIARLSKEVVRSFPSVGDADSIREFLSDDMRA